MPQLKDRLFAVGVLLLGAAASGRVLLSWIQHAEDSQFRQRQEQLRQGEVLNHERVIKECHDRARHTIPAVLNEYKKAGVFPEDWDETKEYEQFYKECLRERGLEP